jgi:hypothetical protein
MYMCCISGAAPLFLSDRAMQKILDRKTKPATYAMDLNLVGDYWGERTGLVVVVVPCNCAQSSAMNGCNRSKPGPQSMTLHCSLWIAWCRVVRQAVLPPHWRCVHLVGFLMHCQLAWRSSPLSVSLMTPISFPMPGTPCGRRWRSHAGKGWRSCGRTTGHAMSSCGLGCPRWVRHMRCHITKLMLHDLLDPRKVPLSVCPSSIFTVYCQVLSHM